MHARLTGRAALAAALVFTSGIYAVAVGAPAAQAASGGDNCNAAGSGGTSGGGGGSVSGSTITMWAQLTVRAQGMLCSGGSSTGSVVDSDWQPPQCWWAPEYQPSDLASAIGSLDTNGGSAIDTYTALNQMYATDGPGAPYTAGYKTTDGPPWQLYNTAPATPDGMWWGLVWSDDITLAGIDSCTAIDNKHFPEDWYWVPDATGAPDPGDAPVLDPQQLAYYIAGKVKLNDVTVQASPALMKATVGLSNWVWADGTNNTVIPQTQICTTDEYGDICVTLSAWAEKLTLSSPAASQVYGDCDLNADTTYIGSAYTGGDGNPPCGLTFGKPGDTTVTVGTTWKVEIDWGGGDLVLNPDPMYQTIGADVQAIQAVNGGAQTSTG